MEILFRMFIVSFGACLVSILFGLLIHIEAEIRKPAIARRERIFRTRECLNMADWLRKEMKKAKAQAYQMRILNGEERFVVNAVQPMLDDMKRAVEHGHEYADGPDLAPLDDYPPEDLDGPAYVCPPMRPRLRR